jgi:hypothetical protein
MIEKLADYQSSDLPDRTVGIVPDWWRDGSPPPWEVR